MLIKRAVHFSVTCSHRLEVHCHSILMLLRRHDRIDKSILIVIRILLVACDPEKLTAELKHVVGIASLVIAICTLFIQNTVCAEMLIFTISACDIGMLINNHLPECLCIFQIVCLAIIYLIAVKSTEELRDGCICMLIIQYICLVSFYILEKINLIKLMCSFLDVLTIISIGILVQFVKNIIHSAILNA